MTRTIVKAVIGGLISSFLLLGIYFSVLSLVSGWEFTQSQFVSFWYFIVILAIGFGIQIGLYLYLKAIVQDANGGKMLGVTGATSTAAMISCCTHYLANLLPIIGAVGLVTFVAQYQTELFSVGIIFNIGGILLMVNKIVKFSNRHI